MFEYTQSNNRLYPEELMLRYDSYWGTWNRVLWLRRYDAELGQSPASCVEFCITPINPCEKGVWEEIMDPKIRVHGTSFGDRDRVCRFVLKTSPVYHEVRALLEQHYSQIQIDWRFFNPSILSMIDWKKYEEIRRGHPGGGISVSQLFKDDLPPASNYSW